MMHRGSTSRHLKTRGLKPLCFYYSAEAFKKYSETPLHHNEGDEAHLQGLRQRWSKGPWQQADQELLNEVTARNEAFEELRRAPLRQELESYFDDPNLDPLPPPLPKRSEWLGGITHPKNYPNAQVRPFFLACEEGSLGVVQQWVSEKREILLQVGVQDGLACAARRNQVNVVRYLLNEGDAFLDGSVIEGACVERSLPLFELCVQHGYHPNQQIPSNNGHFGVALNHCLDNAEITLFLLEHGADPDLAPFQDGRRSGWGNRATPPMDRKCGLALDRAAEGSSSAVVRMLLEYGANPIYARPLHGIVRRQHRIATTQDQPAAGNEEKGDWRPLMETLISHGANVNAVTRYSGTALTLAISLGMWDIVEFLLDHGADPKLKVLHFGGDAFHLAAKRAGVTWESTEALDKYLSYLTSPTSTPGSQEYMSIPNEAYQNPLVQALQKMKTRKAVGPQPAL